MNNYARQFRHMRRHLSPGVRARSALAWVALGFALGWSVHWRPSPRPVHPAAPVGPLHADMAALSGRRIRVLSSLKAQPGEPGAGLDAWLRVTLRAAGAQVDSAASRDALPAAPSPDMQIRLEPAASAPGSHRGPWFAFAEGDSASARAAACLAAELSCAYASPVIPPAPLRVSEAGMAGTPGVVVYVPPASVFDPTQRLTAQAMARALALHLRSAQIRGDTTRGFASDSTYARTRM